MFTHSDRALDLLIALWHGHTPEEDGHASLSPTGPPCHVCKPLHVMLGWTWPEYTRWVAEAIQPVRKENTIGTRGIVGVIADGKAMTSYNHFDSYPDALGLSVLLSLRMQQLADGGKVHTWAMVREQARALRMVDERGPAPTAEDKAKLSKFLDLRVSEGSDDDWYCLTRNLQGKLLDMLAVGYMVDADTFPLDSLFCEWGYLLNLDAETFEVYKGFQKAPHNDGFWAGGDRFAREHGDYYPIRLVKSWPLTELPTKDEFLAAFSGDED